MTGIPCSWFESWSSVSPLVKISECHLWDDIGQKCYRNDKACEKPWVKEVEDGNIR